MKLKNRLEKFFVAAATVIIVCCISGAEPANAANATDVIDAFDGDDPFDANINPQFKLNTYKGLITREYTIEGKPTEVKELSYSRSGIGFNFDLDFGVFRDLSLGVTIPAYGSESNSWSLASGVSKENSTLLTQKRLHLPGEDSLTPEQAKETYPDIPAESMDSSRSGFGDLVLKLRWQPYNDYRTYYLASLMLGVDYIISTGTVHKPGLEDTGGIGRGVNYLHFIIAFSKRMSHLLDPYVVVDYYLPQTTGKSLIDPGHNVGFKMGSELVVWENQGVKSSSASKKKQNEDDMTGKFLLDLYYIARYTSEAPLEYTPASDILVMHKPFAESGKVDLADAGRVTREEQFITMGGGFGIGGEIGKYVKLNLDLNFLHDFQHYITYTYYGKDLNGDGIVAPNSNEYSENFDKYTDEPGRRLRIKNVFRLGLTFGFTVML